MVYKQTELCMDNIVSVDKLWCSAFPLHFISTRHPVVAAHAHSGDRFLDLKPTATYKHLY